MHAPTLIITRGKVCAVMRAARLRAPDGGACDEHCNVQEISGGATERRTRYLLKFPQGALDGFAAADDSDALPHQPADALFDCERNLAGSMLRVYFPLIFGKCIVRG